MIVQLENYDPTTAILTLNRPEKRNALSLELIEAITSAVSDAAKDSCRRVLIIRAEGPSFCAGLDLKEAAQPGGAEHSAEALAKMFEAICDSPLVTIAAAQGAAMGGGAGLVIACDLVIASQNLQLGFPEVQRGLVAALVTTILRRQVRDRTAREMVLLGQTTDARNALAMGLINRAVPESRMMQEAIGVAGEVCKGAPNAIVRSKRLLDDLAPRPMREELQRALKYHLQQRNSAEAKEGTAAFNEKRKPNWGRRNTT
ncbi:MAG TPA: enoyl-CoA hydratase-related protein [Tepidisphaeraceae bacterium]|jgi:methylglutaconyl-CoA hydratase